MQKAHLSLHDQGASNKAYGKNKLKDHQPAKQEAPVNTRALRLPVESLNRGKSRYDSSRIASCNQPHPDGQTSEGGQAGRRIGGQHQFLAGKAVESRQQEVGQSAPKAESDQRQQERFPPKLLHKLPPGSPTDLAHAHLLGTRHGSADSHGDEINSGQQQNKQSNTSHNQRIAPVTHRHDTGREFVVQVNIGQGLKTYLVFTGTIAFRDPRINERLHPVSKFRRFDTLMKQHVSFGPNVGPTAAPTFRNEISNVFE